MLWNPFFVWRNLLALLFLWFMTVHENSSKWGQQDIHIAINKEFKRGKYLKRQGRENRGQGYNGAVSCTYTCTTPAHSTPSQNGWKSYFCMSPLKKILFNTLSVVLPKEISPPKFLGFLYFLYLCRPSEASPRHSAIPGGNLPWDRQSLLWAV